MSNLNNTDHMFRNRVSNRESSDAIELDTENKNHHFENRVTDVTNARMTVTEETIQNNASRPLHRSSDQPSIQPSTQSPRRPATQSSNHPPSQPSSQPPIQPNGNSYSIVSVDSAVNSPPADQMTSQPITSNDKGCGKCNFYKKVQDVISGAFERYGRIVGTYPWVFILLPILVFGGLGAGFVKLDQETDLEMVYFPKQSRAMDDRETVRDIIGDTEQNDYNPFIRDYKEQQVTLLFKSKSDSNILRRESLNEIIGIILKASNLNVTVDGMLQNFSNVCLRSKQQCVIEGNYIFSPKFQQDLANGSVTYPVWNGLGSPIDLSNAISGQTVSSGILTSATVLKFSFKLKSNSAEWQKRFLTFASSLNPNLTEVAYEISDSLSIELDKGTKGDIFLFAMTITICCIYASVVTSGGNPVSTRSMLAFGGILSAGLGIVGSMGLLNLCGVKFVNIVGVLPFLIIGIGVDDMFLLMSAWSETIPKLEKGEQVSKTDVINHLGRAFARAGIGITITSLTDFLAFVIGTTSIFMSVTNFSLYAGIAVLFCYIANATLFGGCLAYHGRRVYSSRHFLTYCKVKSKEELKAEGRSWFIRFFCGGSPPAKEGDDQSPLEKLPQRVLPVIFSNRIFSSFIIIVFLGYLAAAIYGVIHLKQGLELNQLVPPSSYYHKYLTLNNQHFPVRVPILFFVKQEVDYSGEEGNQFLALLAKARTDSQINPYYQFCWLSAYQNSSFYNATTQGGFVYNLVNGFLPKNQEYQPFVLLNVPNDKILASICMVVSKPLENQYDQAELMVRMRDLGDASGLPVVVYHYSFVAYEQFLAVKPATLQMVGVAVGVMAFVSFLFMPHLLMVLLITITIVMILTGIFGFMYYWDISLSSITMIHLVMSVGFSVDFSAHVCSAYLLSKCVTRLERATDAIKHSGGPILNGGISTLLGVVLLSRSNSYIFVSFFRVMFLVIAFGIIHAIFFLPAVLSLIGPQNPKEAGDVEDSKPLRKNSKLIAVETNSDSAGHKKGTELNGVSHPILTDSKVNGEVTASNSFANKLEMNGKALNTHSETSRPLPLPTSRRNSKDVNISSLIDHQHITNL